MNMADYPDHRLEVFQQALVQAVRTNASTLFILDEGNLAGEKVQALLLAITSQGQVDLPDFVGMAARDEVELNRQLVMTSFPVDHRVRSLGYTTWEKRKKLLPELVGLPGPEIAARKYAGLPIEACLDVIDHE
jgi:hypothetical protein